MQSPGQNCPFSLWLVGHQCHLHARTSRVICGRHRLSWGTHPMGDSVCLLRYLEW